jgi:hypothetical protein
LNGAAFDAVRDHVTSARALDPAPDPKMAIRAGGLIVLIVSCTGFIINKLIASRTGCYIGAMFGASHRSASAIVIPLRRA